MSNSGDGESVRFEVDFKVANLTHYHLIDILSIDSIFLLEVGKIKLSVQINEKEVVAFLAGLKKTLCSEDFDIDKDFIMIRRKKEPGKEQYSTVYTLADLDYDAGDVVERLKELTIKEYSETLMDIDDVNPPLLFVFGKDINGKQVYIKLKLKGEQARHVLCVSFHYAERNMTFPFA